MKVQPRVTRNRIVKRFAMVLNQLNQHIQQWVDNVEPLLAGEEGDRLLPELNSQTIPELNQQVIAAVQTGVIIYDRNLRYHTWNRFMEELSGIAAEQVLGRYCLDMVSFLCDNGICALLERALAGETISIPDTFLTVPETGKSGWISVQFIPLHDQQGEIVGVLGIIQDITERKEINQRLQHSEAQQRALIDALPDLIMRLSGDGVYLDFLAAQNFKVIGGKDLIGTRVEESLPPDLAQLRMTAIQTALQTGELQVYEQEIWIEGKLRIEECRVLAYRENEVLIIGRDITEQKQAEAALRESEAKNRAMLAAIPDLLLRIKADGTCLDFIPPSTAPETLFLPIQFNVAEILTPEIWQYQQQRMEQAATTGELQVWEHQILKDGILCDEEVRLVSCGTDEYLVIVRDITEQKQAEQELRQREEQLQAIATNLPGGIFRFIYHADGRHSCPFVSEGYRTLFEIDPTELRINPSLGLEMVHPEDRAIYEDAAANAIAGQTNTFQAEVRYILPTGEVKWISTTAQLQREANDDVIVDGINIDITYRKQIELEISQSRDLREAIFNESTDAIFLVDSHTQLTLDCNKRAVELFEATSKDDLLNVEGHSLQRQQFSAEELSQIVDELNTQGFWNLEVEYVTLQGRSFWGNLAAKQITVAGKTLNLVRVTDVSDRKQAEAKIQQSEELLQLTLEFTGIGAWSWQPSTGDYQWNGKMVELLELPAGLDNMFEIWCERMHPDDLAHVTATLDQSLATGKALSAEYRYQLSDGRMAWRWFAGQGIYSETGELDRVLGVVQDIDDRKQAELELQQREEQLQAIAASIPGYLYRYVVHPDGTTSLPYVSVGAEQIYKLPLATIRADTKHVFDAIHPNDRSAVAAVIANGVQTLTSYNIEFRIIDAVGKVKWLNIIAQVHRSTNGDTVFDGLCLDISKRRRLELEREQSDIALRASEAQYRRIVETANEGIWIVDAESKTYFVNPKMVEILGYSAEEMLGKSMFDFMDEAGVACALESEKRRRQGIIEQHDLKFQHKNGTEVWVLISTNPILDHAGRYMGALGMVTDITDRKRAEAALQESEARFRQIAETVREGFFVFEPISCRYSYVNPAYTAITGVSAELLYEHGTACWLERLYPDDRDRILDRLERERQGEIFDEEYRFVHPDGSIRWVRAQAFPLLDNNRNTIRVVGTIQDTTDRKLAEEALRRSEERWQLAVEGSNDGIWDHDLITNEHFLSPRCLEILGYDYEQVKSFDQWLSYIHPDDRSILQTTFQAYLDHQTPIYVMEYRMRARDGSYKWLRARGKGVWDETGRPIRAIGSITDITLQKQDELAFQSLVEGTASFTGVDFFPVLTQQIATVLNVSQVLITRRLKDDRLQSLAFYSDEQIQGNICYSLIHTPCERSLQTGCYYCPSGIQAEFPLDTDLVLLGTDSYFGLALRNSLGEAIGVLCVFDRTPIVNPKRIETLLRIFGARAAAELERLQAMEAIQELNASLEERVRQRTQDLQQAYARLQDSETRFQTFMNNSPTTSWISDSDGRMVYVSQNYYRTFQLSTSEASGKSLFELYPEEIAQQFFKKTQAVARTNQVLETIELAPRIDGSMGEFLVYKFPLPDSSGQCLIGGIAIDITERRKAEEAIRLSEEQLQLALEGSGDGIWDWNIVTGATYLSPRWLKMLGYKEGELPGTIDTWESLIHPEDKPAVMTTLNAHLHDAAIPYEVEFRARSKTGEWRWVLDFGKVVAYTETGAPLRMVGLQRDITDRKQAEAALRQSEQDLRTIFNNVYDAILIHDMDGNILDANDRALELRQATREQLLASTITDLSAPDAPVEYIPKILQRVQAGETMRFEWRERRFSDNSIFDVEVSLRRVTLGDRPVFIAGVRDISDRKQAEIDLRDSESRLAERNAILQSVIESTPDVIFVKDREGRILIANSSFASFFEQPIETLLGKDDAALWPPDMAHQLRQLDLRIMERGMAETLEESVPHPDGIGKSTYLTTKSPWYDTEGNVIGTIGLSRDITDRKRAEEALQSERLRLQLALDAAQMGTWSCNLQTGTLIWSDRAQEIFGFTPGTFPGDRETFLSLVHVEDRDRVIGEIAHTFETGAPYNIEYRIYRLDGEVRWIAVWGIVPQVLQAELPVADRHLIGVVADITDRKKSEADLRDSEARFRVTFDQAAVGIVQIDLAGRYVQANQKFADIVQYSQSELYSLSFTDVTYPDDLAEDQANVDRLMAGETSNFVMEKRYIRKNGSIVWVNLSVSLVRDLAGSPQYFIGVVEDITDRKKAERDLQESRNMLKLVLDTIPQRVFWKDRESRFLGCNPAFANDYQLTYEDIVGKTDLELPWAEWAHLYREDDATVINSRTPKLNYEEPTNNLEGEQIWIRSSKIPLTNSQGEVIGVLGCYDDITERKRAEEALRDNEERLRLALTAANLGLYDLNLQTGEAIVTPEYATMLGYNPATFRETNAKWIERLHPDDQESVAATYQAYIAGEIPEYKVEFRQLTQSGQWKWILSIGKIVAWDEAGQPLRMLGTHTDIDERKQAEAQLREQEQFLRSIYEGVTQPIFVADILPDNSVRVVGWNPIAALLMGKSSEEVMGKTIEEIFPEQAASEILDRYAQCITSRQPLTFEECLFLGGETRWMLSTYNPLADEDGRVYRVIGRAFDITDRKRLEQELLQINAELERRVEERTTDLQQAMETAETANRAKSTFLANMSHELRTPLNAILGFSQLMSHDHTLDSEHRQQLGIINHSGEHLLNLINDILEMSKIEAGQVSFNTNPFDLYTMLETLEDMFCLRAAEKGLQLEFNCAPNVPQCIETDENKLRQVLINLIGNAIKFTKKGYIIVSVTLVQECGNSNSMPPSLDSVTLCFSVEDTGPGIDPNESEQLFEPFIQSENRQISQEGTGLGLPISRQFVRMMGGELLVSSTIGQGSNFSFQIQVQLAEVSDLPVRSPLRQVISLAPNQPTYRILIVEDQATNRQLLLQMLQLVGFEVQAATNGQEAIALWESWHPQLIWMDMRMPVLDGYEATQQIRQREQQTGTSTIIIALTANVFEEERARALAVGCDDFVRKPFQEAELLQKMAHYLNAEYLYAEADQSGVARITPLHSFDAISALRTLPESWLAHLYQATIQLDSTQITALIEQIAPEQPILATLLTQKLENFDLQQILDLLEEARQMEA